MAIPAQSLSTPGRASRRGSFRKAPALSTLTFRPVDADTRADFEAFFSSPGAPKFCWCMVWRRTAAEAKENDSASRRRQMMARLDANTPIGLLAYHGDTPVGWVSIAPRETYRNLGGPESEPGEIIWSLVCFFVPRRLRGQGMMTRMIGAAVDHAKANGGTIIEAYPVDADAPSYRFMGFVPVFAEAGFVEVGRTGKRRHVVRRALSET